MSQSKKGISALQIHRQIGSGDYRTAWYMCHRIRAAMKDSTFPKLMGEVEVDETYIAARAKTVTHRNAASIKAQGRLARSASLVPSHGKAMWLPKSSNALTRIRSWAS
jgi:hypothetical protein